MVLSIETARRNDPRLRLIDLRDQLDDRLKEFDGMVDEVMNRLPAFLSYIYWNSISTDHDPEHLKCFAPQRLILESVHLVTINNGGKTSQGILVKEKHIGPNSVCVMLTTDNALGYYTQNVYAVMQEDDNLHLGLPVPNAEYERYASQVCNITLRPEQAASGDLQGGNYLRPAPCFDSGEGVTATRLYPPYAISSPEIEQLIAYSDHSIRQLDDEQVSGYTYKAGDALEIINTDGYMEGFGERISPPVNQAIQVLDGVTELFRTQNRDVFDFFVERTG